MANEIYCKQILAEPGGHGCQDPGNLTGGASEKYATTVLEIGDGVGDGGAHVALTVLRADAALHLPHRLTAHMPRSQVIVESAAVNYPTFVQKGLSEFEKNSARRTTGPDSVILTLGGEGNLIKSVDVHRSAPPSRASERNSAALFLSPAATSEKGVSGAAERSSSSLSEFMPSTVNRSICPTTPSSVSIREL